MLCVYISIFLVVLYACVLQRRVLCLRGRVAGHAALVDSFTHTGRV